MKKSNKKPLIAIALIALIGVVGGTIALFSSETSLTNIFRTGTYSSETEEKFVSPNDWRPGQDVTKEVKVTNTGDYEIAVRAKLEPKWTSAANGTLALQKDSEDIAKINMPNTPTDWKLGDDGYYYYLKSVPKNTATSLLIDKVTLNTNLDDEDLGISCVESEIKEGENVVGKKSTCTSSTTGYAGATYELKITVQTIQYDAYASEWSGRGTGITIAKAQ